MLLGGLRPHVLSHPVACFCFAVVLLCCCVAVLLCCCVAVLLGGGGGGHGGLIPGWASRSPAGLHHSGNGVLIPG